MISACLAWLDKCFREIWVWCVDAIVDELGSFTRYRILVIFVERSIFITVGKHGILVPDL